jgi:acyl carrier protein
MEKLKACFVEALGIPSDVAFNELAYQKYYGWDSVGHMRLVATIEEAFGISFSTDQIFEMSDFKKAQSILKAHKIVLDS